MISYNICLSLSNFTQNNNLKMTLLESLSEYVFFSKKPVEMGTFIDFTDPLILITVLKEKYCSDDITSRVYLRKEL